MSSSSASAAAQPAATLAAHRGPVNAACFNSDGGYCMTGGDDRKILLWNPHRDGDMTPIKEYTGHNQRILDISIASDNKSFASCGGDRPVFVWDVMTGQVIRRLLGHEQRVNAVQYNAECSVLVSGSYDRTVRCWDMRSRNTHPIQIITGSADSVSSVAMTAHEILSSSIDGQVRVYDMRAGRVSRDELGPPVGHVALSNDGNCILAATLDSTLRLLDKASGVILCEYRGHENNSFKLGACLSRNDAHVLCGSEDGALHAWDIVEGKQISRVQCHRGAIVALSCHPKGEALLTGSHDGTAKMWRPRTSAGVM